MPNPKCGVFIVSSNLKSSGIGSNTGKFVGIMVLTSSPLKLSVDRLGIAPRQNVSKDIIIKLFIQILILEIVYFYS